jgi:hypothetical protein
MRAKEMWIVGGVILVNERDRQLNVLDICIMNYFVDLRDQ